jgi:hypothetical protein
MALRLKSVETVPVTKGLAKKFRDMEALKNERDLKAARAKHHVHLVSAGKFFTPLWGACEMGGEVYRGNGNHTSHVLLACIQAHNGGLDDRSAAFAKELLFSKGGSWSGDKPEDLPEVKDGEFTAVVENFTADDDNDLVTFFKRYDSPESARSRVDLLGIYIGEQSDLADLSRDKVRYALNGVVRACKSDPESFGLTKDDVANFSTTEIGTALRRPQVKKVVRWIVETVPEVDLYKHVVGAQVCAEIFATYGESQGDKIVESMMAQIEAEEDPGASFEAALTKKRNRPTVESLLKKGRTTVKEIAKKV